MQFEQAAILAHQAVEEQLASRASWPGRACGRSRDRAARRAGSPRRRAAAATAPAKRWARASERGSASMRRTCRSSMPGARQPALRGDLRQRLVGTGAPQEERQPRRQIEVAQLVGAAGRGASAGADSSRNRNCGLASIGFERGADAALEVALVAAHLVEAPSGRRSRRRTTGRRNALVATRRTISVAQSCSLRVEVGRQVNTARRLSVSEMPVTRWSARRSPGP